MTQTYDALWLVSQVQTEFNIQELIFKYIHRQALSFQRVKTKYTKQIIVLLT